MQVRAFERYIPLIGRYFATCICQMSIIWRSTYISFSKKGTQLKWVESTVAI